jgi:uncharacterized protein
MAEKYPGNDNTQLQRLIADARVAHVALVAEGAPVVIPTAVVYHDGDVLLHGSTGSKWLRLVAQGIPVSVAITAIDGLVVARSAFESSIHYRSAVLFGTCGPAANPEEALDLLTDGLIPGRIAEVRRPTAKEVAATLALRLSITEWTLKVSDGWPDDPADDVAGTAWAGVVPLVTRFADPIPAPDLRDDIAEPASVAALPR